jgi:flagellar hook-length control protein FliK
MKTQDVSSNRPVQQNNDQGNVQAKKPQKEFSEVLDAPGNKSAGSAKKKSFSPLNADKGAGTEKSKTHSSRDRDRIEGRDDAIEEKEMGKGKKKSGVSAEDVQIQANAGMSGPGGLHGAAKLEKVHATRGLNMEEIQSIVKKVHVGVTETGKPEMRFEIHTHNLGPMQLNISADGDKIKIDFATQDVHAQELLKENLSELSQRLSEKGLNLSQTTFSSRDQDQSEKEQQQSEQAWEGPMFTDTPGRPKKGFSL